LKDSPAAAATLGMSLTRTKLAAFAISAGIAACAGALAGDKVSPQQYDFTQSLPIVLLAVVGGVGSVAGALFGGMLLGGNSVLATIVPSVKNLTKIGPGTIGITLGRNPQGAAAQIGDSFRPLTEQPRLIAISAAGAVGIWALDTTNVISHWSFFVASVVWILAISPNLPALMAAAPARRAMAVAWLAIAMVIAAGVDWGTALDATGKRIILIIGLVALFGVGAQRLLESAPRMHDSSPDLAGLDRDFDREEIELAEQKIGVVL
jgi:branched-chain amino acid transport system permease protein